MSVTTTRPNFRPSPEETVLVSQIFSEAAITHATPKSKRSKPNLRHLNSSSSSKDKDGTGYSSSKSKLLPPDLISTQILRHNILNDGANCRMSKLTFDRVFDVVNPSEREWLSREDVGILVRLIGWAQVGVEVRTGSYDLYLIARCGPTPIISGLPILQRDDRGQASREYRASSKYTPTPENDPERNPFSDPEDAAGPSHHQTPEFKTLSQSKRLKYLEVFERHHPIEGVLPSRQVWKAFAISRLPAPALATIWELVDEKHTGDLPRNSFIMGMYFIDNLMKKRLLPSNIPTSLPPWLIDQATTGPEFTPKYERFLPSQPYGIYGEKEKEERQKHHWSVTRALRKSSKPLFKELDTKKRGYIKKPIYEAFMERSKLDSVDIDDIWFLAAGQKERIYIDEFMLALFLMHRLLGGQRLPSTLPPSFIPPALRSSSSTPSEREDEIADDEAPTDIPNEVISNAREIYPILDLEQTGLVGEDVIKPFLRDSLLPEEDILKIWDMVSSLSDGNPDEENGISEVKRSGESSAEPTVDEEGFVLLMFLMHRKLGGLDWPKTLPRFQRYAKDGDAITKPGQGKLAKGKKAASNAPPIPPRHPHHTSKNKVLAAVGTSGISVSPNGQSQSHVKVIVDENDFGTGSNGSEKPRVHDAQGSGSHSDLDLGRRPIGSSRRSRSRSHSGSNSSGSAYEDTPLTTGNAATTNGLPPQTATEVGELRLLVQGLVEENEALRRQSSMTDNASNTNSRAAGTGRARGGDDDGESVAPPPYTELQIE